MSPLAVRLRLAVLALPLPARRALVARLADDLERVDRLLLGTERAAVVLRAAWMRRR